MIMELLDKLVMLLGTCVMSLEEYAELLDAGLSELKVGLIPQEPIRWWSAIWSEAG